MDTITQRQTHWLEALQSVSKQPLRVSRNVNGKPSQWVSREEAEFPVDYRTVLHNEVVIDIDCTRWNEVKMFAEMVTETLNTQRIPYITAYTGGRGIHIHLFFFLSEDQKRKCEDMDVMPKDLRVWLLEYILTDCGITPKLIGPGKPFDTSCINWNDEGKGHLVRLFGGKKRGYKTVVTEIPEERPRTKEVTFPDSITKWYIPDQLFKEFIDHFKRYNKERVESTTRYRAASQNFTGTYMNLPCVQRIVKGMPEGQRNAGAHILAIASHLDGMPREDMEKTMLSYAETCPQNDISHNEYLGWVHWILNQKKLFWNCRFCKELGVCEKDCEFRACMFKEEYNFLQDENLLENLVKILGKKIKRDEKNRLLVFLVCLSAYGSNPLNLFLKGESSVGKTHLAKTVAEYFPEKDVWFIGDMSPKALIHEHGRLENGKVYISLQDKILVFMESPRKETLEMLRPILSHDRREIEYKITDRIAGKLGTKKVIIEGWPATLFCSTDYKFLEELSTRSMLTTPDISKEKIREVLAYKGRQYSRPWLNVEDEQERLLKKAVDFLKTEVEVCVPYAEELAETYERNEPRVMRDFDKLMELIRMSAFLHQEQRIRFGVGDERSYLIANEYDFWVGRSLFDSVRETTVTGVPQPVIDFYDEVLCEIPGSITYQSIREKYVAVHKMSLSRTRLRTKFLEPLEDIGWLTHEPDPADGRRVIFVKCRLEGESDGTMDSCDHSYFRDIFPEERLKEYLGELEEVWNLNVKCDGGTCEIEEDYDWFFSERVPYFLEENNGVDTGKKDEGTGNCESSVNGHTLEEKKEECVMKEQRLLDEYDEETVLQQIPQDDTRIEDVLKRFENQNRAVDTLAVLQDRGKIIAGQGNMRRLVASGVESLGDVDVLRLSKWTCSDCGAIFYAQEPFRNYDERAICRKCRKRLINEE
jgi:hypothetical protein